MTQKFLVPIVLPADPAAAMEAATKQYVDGRTGGLYAYVDSGYGQYNSAPTLNGATVLTLAVPTVAYQTRLFVTAHGMGSSDIATMDGVVLTIVPAYGPAGQRATPNLQGSVAGRYGAVGANYSWVVPTSQSSQFSITVAWATTGGGTTYVVADALWHRFRS